MDPDLPVPPSPPHTARYAFTAPGEPLRPGETEIDDLLRVPETLAGPIPEILSGPVG